MKSNQPPNTVSPLLNHFPFRERSLERSLPEKVTFNFLGANAAWEVLSSSNNTP